MSGNYVQRGDVALVDKFKRAEIAVQNGVDLVIEMPVVYSLSNAEMFGRAGVMMLGSLGCVDGISFGCENDSITMLKNAAEASIAAAVPEKIKPLLEQGIPFPQALQQVIGLEAGPLVAEVFDDPNNTLAIEYIKSMKFLGLDFDILPVKREEVAHDDDKTTEHFASGSKLREMVENDEDISAFVPKEMLDAINEYQEAEHLCYFDNLEREFLFMLRKSTPQQLSTVPDMAKGLDNRILEAGRMATSLDEFLKMVKTKRFTMARIRRILLNMYIGTQQSDILVPPSFGRILAFNDRGVEIIKASKEKNADGKNKLSVPFSSDIKELFESPSPVAKRFAYLTTIASDLYSLAARDILRSGTDFTAKVGKLTTIDVPIPFDDGSKKAEESSDDSENPSSGITSNHLQKK
jgi:predicted nucleotidyltransferase